MKTSVEVEEFDDEPYCPKCGRTKSNEGISYRYIGTIDGFLLMCGRCGYEWLMSADEDEDE